jgi:hypothetical protein
MPFLAAGAASMPVLLGYLTDQVSLCCANVDTVYYQADQYVL